MTILVCPLSRVEELVTRHNPARVISMLNPTSAFPELGPHYDGRHLRLSFHDICEPEPGLVLPASEHIRDLIRFLGSCDRNAPLLIHCRAGLSRSTATAYIATCLANPEADELEIARALRKASPLARPNSRLIDLADQELGRDGRMSAAIAETGRELEWIEIDENEPFQLAWTAGR